MAWWLLGLGTQSFRQTRICTKVTKVTKMGSEDADITTSWHELAIRVLLARCSNLATLCRAGPTTQAASRSQV